MTATCCLRFSANKIMTPNNVVVNADMLVPFVHLMSQIISDYNYNLVYQSLVKH